jgi:hypothetical protein
MTNNPAQRYSRKNVAELNGIARLAQRTHTNTHTHTHSWVDSTNTSTNTHTHTHTHTLHKPQKPTSSFFPVTIIHMTVEERGRILTGGFSDPGIPGERERNRL